MEPRRPFSISGTLEVVFQSVNWLSLPSPGSAQSEEAGELAGEKVLPPLPPCLRQGSWGGSTCPSSDR